MSGRDRKISLRVVHSKLKTWMPYDKLVLERDPMYWDAATVKLDEIYLLSDNRPTYDDESVQGRRDLMRSTIAGCQIRGFTS